MTETTFLVEDIPLNMNSDDVRNLFETVTIELVERIECISPKKYEVVLRSGIDADRVIKAFVTRVIINNKPIKITIKPKPSLVKGIIYSQGIGHGGGGGGTNL